MRADLVSVLIGGNDLSALRPDPDRLAAELETGVAQLARSGATVLLATAYDPGFSPYLRMLRGRPAVFTAHVHAIAAKHGCLVLDLWTIPGLTDRAMWSEDRLHPSTRGHLALLRAAASARPPDPDHLRRRRRATAAADERLAAAPHAAVDRATRAAGLERRRSGTEAAGPLA